MKPEKKHLIDDLLDDGRDAHRETTLLAGGRILRRRRRRRAALQTFAVIALLGVAAVALQRTFAFRQHRHDRAVVPVPPATQPRSLTDDELLALFPNTPVALATLPDGKKRLIFPRPGDEQRFVSRL